MASCHDDDDELSVVYSFSVIQILLRDTPTDSRRPPLPPHSRENPSLAILQDRPAAALRWRRHVGVSVSVSRTGYTSVSLRMVRPCRLSFAKRTLSSWVGTLSSSALHILLK
ncbi:hypothetical protein KOW79_012796 [Hemibagrus wyckioides]|uniref:Uncharacterized protein n=1 Tax=Hemibagrus wyckioides TaxID=337641 RepID=A0A9D3NIQ1_9TELE|nr:hypothetical protein KOW79_012796 [Hemibagrus wyckioides]